MELYVTTVTEVTLVSQTFSQEFYESNSFEKSGLNYHARQTAPSSGRFWKANQPSHLTALPAVVRGTRSIKYF